MVNKDKQVKKFPIRAIDHNVERMLISLLHLNSSAFMKFMFAFKKYTFKTKYHVLNHAVIAQGIKHCKENCFRFTEIPFPVDRGSSNLGESKKAHSQL